VRLGALSLLLGLLLAGTLYLGAHRFGWIDPPPPVRWRFENRLLTAALDQQLFIRPMLDADSAYRIAISHIEAEPERDTPDAIYPEPYVAYSIAERRPHEEDFLVIPPGLIPLKGLGALTAGEWLHDIGVVREKIEGGGEREVLRMRCGQPSGGSVSYYFDPERPVDPLGWFRQEVLPPDVSQSRVFFASRVD